MGKVFADISMSLDGFIAGPNPTLKEPLGESGEDLHQWVVRLSSWRQEHGMTSGEVGNDDDMFKETIANVGAVIMGRRMFSGGSGPWETDPNPDGWWGETPPFHAPVFILTSHQRQKSIKKGGSSFIFVTDGIGNAFAQAKKTAGDKDISIAGGAQTIQQIIKAGLLDELQIHLVPILLGGGTRLFENLDGIKLEKNRVIDSEWVTHLKFLIKK